MSKLVAKDTVCLVPIPKKLDNSWMAADLSHLLSVDKIRVKMKCSYEMGRTV